MIEHAINSPVEPVNPGIFLIEFSPGKGLPELYFSLCWVCSRGFSDYPGVGAFRVRPNADIRFEAKAEQEVAKKHSVVFGIATTSREEALD
jgi:hypothetical protein